MVDRFYGKIRLEKSTWILDCEPQISILWKRMFPQSQKRDGTLEISDNDETRRNIEWFTSRYALEISGDDRKNVRKGARRHEDQILRLEKIVDQNYKPLDVRLALPPRDYQKVGAEVSLEVKGLLIADEVGLGKTCLAICTMAAAWTLPAVVVTLAGSMPFQWQEEIAKFMPQLFTHIVKKGTVYEVPMRDGRGPDVFIVTYHKLSGWDKTFRSNCRSVIFDEAHELRHKDSQKYDAAMHLASGMKLRLGLSATPIFNYGGEIYNVLEVLRPGALGTPEEFYQTHCHGSYRTDPVVRDPKALGSYLRENFLMIRRTRKDVGRELPPLQKIPQHVESDPAALDRVSDSAAELARMIVKRAEEAAAIKLGTLSEDDATKSEVGEIMQAGGQLSIMLRQATGIAKAPYVADFVRLLVESGERVLCFLFHREVYDIVMSKLSDLKPVMYTGSETPAEKLESRRKFMAGESPVMLMSLRAGAGIDGLQKVCRTVVIGELDWAPAVHEQNIGRIFRDGQMEPVTSYFLVARDGADPLIAEKLGLKRQQAEGIRNPEMDVVEEYQVDKGRALELAQYFLKKKGVKSTEPEKT